jgi:hypothetical protein
MRWIALCLALLAVPAWAQSRTYYYVATAYNSANTESAPTNEVSTAVSASNPKVVITWELPTMNTDGSALTDLQGIRLYRSQMSSGCANVKNLGCSIVTDTRSATLTTYTDTPPLPAVPAPPTNLTVQAGNLTAYAVQLSHDALALLPVGTAPAGTPCGGETVTDRNGITAHIIPSDLVQWAGSVKSGAAFAQCSAG